MVADLRARIGELMAASAWSELAELVSLKSVADPRQFPPEECAKTAEWVRDRFAQLGFADARLERTPARQRCRLGSRSCGDPDAPTVLLYAHYDVQPPLDDDAWRTPPFVLTEADGRWYGRGAADCKGNIIMHLLALRALGDDIPVNLKLVVEGSEEQGTGGLEAFVEQNPDLLRADAILVCDTGNAAVGKPAATVTLRGMANVVVRVEALASEVHSGMFGGPAPDALAALVAILASLRDERGETTVTGLDHSKQWTGAPYPPDQFRTDAGVARRRAVARRWQRVGHAVVAAGDHDPRHRLPARTGSTAAIVPQRRRPPEPADSSGDVGDRRARRARGAPARRGAVGRACRGRDRGRRVAVRAID